MENALQSPAVTAGWLTKFLPQVFSALLKLRWRKHCTVWGEGAACSGWDAPGGGSPSRCEGPRGEQGAGLWLPALHSMGALQGASQGGGKRDTAKVSLAPHLSLSSKRENSVNPGHERNKEQILPTKQCRSVSRN